MRDHLRNVKRTVSKHVVSMPSDTVVTAAQDDSALASVPSPSGKRLGVLREISEGASKKRFVEVWFGDRLEATKEVTKTHEGFHVNRTPVLSWSDFFCSNHVYFFFAALFFSLSFSKSETSLVYTAEAKAAESSETSPVTASKFRFVPDFGERNIGKKRPTLYLFCWNAHRYENEPDHPAPKAETDEKMTQSSPTVVALKPSLPENSSFVFGQASFAPDQKTIFATGYEETFDGRRLGAVGCWNHPSAIFKLELPKELPADSEEITIDAHRLTPPELSARSPRVTDTASGESYSTVWLANPIGGPHSSCTSLHYLRSDENQSKILVDYVFDPIGQPGGFPGLYVEQLPSRPFLSLNPGIKRASHLVTHSFWGSRQTVLAISLLSCNNVQDLTPDPNHTWTVTGTDGKEGLLAVRSAINKPNELVEARFQTLKPVQDWKIIDKPKVAAWG